VRRFVADGTNSSAPSPSAARAFIGIAPRAKGIAGRLVEKMLDNMSGARDVVILVALYLSRYNVVAHNHDLEKGLAGPPLVVIAGLDPATPITRHSRAP
jgi:hypothetical protein